MPGIEKKRANIPKSEERQSEEAKEINREIFEEMKDLRFKVETDLTPVLEAVNEKLNVALKPRSKESHMTVIGPSEYKVLKKVTEEQIKKLKSIQESVSSGEGVEIDGIGFLDGSTADVKEKDRGKKAVFVSLRIPKLNAFRRELGLPEKDFHITLGFENGDIHYDSEGNPIQKQADEQFNELTEHLEDLEFGRLTGALKKRKKKKQPSPEQMEKKRFQLLLKNHGLAGGDLIKLGVKPGPGMGKIIGAIKKTIREGGELGDVVPEELKQPLRDRVQAAREEWGP